MSKLFTSKRFLGQKSPWTKVCLDNCVIGQKSLGQLSPWTMVPWTIVATPYYPPPPQNKSTSWEKLFSNAYEVSPGPTSQNSGFFFSFRIQLSRRRRVASYGVARLLLMAPIDPWRNSTPDFGAVAFCTTNIEDFRTPLTSTSSTISSTYSSQKRSLRWTSSKRKIMELI